MRVSLRNLSIAARLFLLIAILAVFTLVAVLMFQGTTARIERLSLLTVEELMLEGHKEKVRVAAHALAVALGKAVAGASSPEERRKIVRRFVRDIHFEPDGSGYFFAYENTVNIALPPLPKREGEDLAEWRDENGVYFIKELMRRAREGGGFVEYVFPKPGGGEIDKLSYAEMIPGTDMWVGTGVYIDNIERHKRSVGAAINHIFEQHLAIVLGGELLLFALLAVASWMIARSISGPITEATRAAEAIAVGDLSIALDTAGRDEPARLHAALNRMARTIEQAMAEIRTKAAVAEKALRDVEEADREIVRLTTYRIESLKKTATSLAHQIRNPISIIGGFANLLLRKSDQPPTCTEKLHAIIEAARRVEATVGVVQEYTSLRLGELTEVSVAELIDEQRERIERKAAAIGSRVEWSLDLEPLRPRLDRPLITRALSEIMDNAFDSFEGGPGRIAVSAAKKGAFMLLRIRDDGKGISEDEQLYIFDPFFSTKTLGGGLGLPLAERVIMEHGGSLRIESSLGHGALAEIQVPLEPVIVV